MKVRPTPPPITPAMVRRRVARTAIGAGAIAAGLVVGCGGKTTADNQQTAIAPQTAAQDPVSPQAPMSGCDDTGGGARHCVPPQDPPQVTPQPPPPQPPQVFDGGILDASDPDGDAG